jgi:hypothetical protein
MPAPPPCRLVSCPKFISGAWCACPAPLPPGQLPEIHFGRPVCLLRSAAAWSVARNSFRASSVPALPPCRPVSRPKCISGVQYACPARCRPVSCPKFISDVQYACPAPLPPGQLPEIHFGCLVCLPCPAAAWSVARNSFRASSVPAPLRCRLVSCPKFISGVQYACPARLPPGQSPEIHFGRPVCLPRPAASVARNSLRASSMPAPPRCVSRPKFIAGVQYACPAPLRQSPEIHFGRPVCLPRPAASVARNSFRASSVPAPPRCVSRPKFIAGVQYACPAPLPPGQLPEIHFGRPVCLPRPAAAWSVTRNVFRAPSMPAPPRCVSRPKFIAGVQYACPAPLPVARNSLRASSVPAPPRCVSRPEIHCGRPVCLPRPAASVARNSLRASSVPAPPRCRLVSYPKCISGAWCACPAPLPPGQLPEMYFGRLVCLPRSAVATYNLYAPSARRNLSELVTTKTELHAIAAAASMGLSCHPVSG